MARGILGLDIGGANLKAAHLDAATTCRTLPFSLWRDPAGLAGALAELMRSLPDAGALAVTMTGELCDCFASKREGVLHILTAVENVAEERPVRVWCCDGSFRDLAGARAEPLQAAASNWLALATWAGRFVPHGPALLLDIGSTTTDIIPLLDGVPVPVGRSDPERLRSGELVYTGTRRTPLCALAGSQTAAEFFATTLDVYLVLGAIKDDPKCTDTADGRPATRKFAHARLARMLCADLETSTEEERETLAAQIRDQQLALIARAIERVANRLPSSPAALILSGSGEFLGRNLLSGPATSIAKLLGREASTAACAHAVAVLARERPA